MNTDGTALACIFRHARQHAWPAALRFVFASEQRMRAHISMCIVTCVRLSKSLVSHSAERAASDDCHALDCRGRQAQHGIRCRVRNGGVCGGVSQRCGRVVRPIEWKRCHRSEYALKALTFWRVPQQRLGVVRIPSGLVYER